MDFAILASELTSVIERYPSLLIFIKGSPDPDAIASSFALKVIAGARGTNAVIACTARPSLPQNQALIDDLEIDINYDIKEKDLKDFDAYAVLDFQSAHIETVSHILPCAVHIDHHAPGDDNTSAEFRLLTEYAGATSSLLALMLKEIIIPEDKITAVCTALMMGIKTDTDLLVHAEKFDFRALKYISAHTDTKILDHVSGIPLPSYIFELIASALENSFMFKDWLFAGIGYVKESERDCIAIIADYLLKRENCRTAAVFAVIEKNNKSLRLDVSLRSSDRKTDLDSIIKTITTQGGGRKYKGAYQIELEYFSNCPDKDALWNVIDITTKETLKRARDDMYIIGIKGMYKRIRQGARKIFGTPDD